MEEKFRTLIEKAEELPYGQTKVALLEEAVRIADAHLSPKQSFEARRDLTRAAHYSGKAEKAIVAFAWCLNYYDKNPKKFDFYDTWNLMWQYKWIAKQLCSFPEISLQTIEDTLEDFRKRCEKLGFNLRMYYKMKMKLASHTGNEEEEKYYFEKWLATDRDDLADCEACEKHDHVIYLLNQGKIQEAYELAQPIFDGILTCQTIPHSTYANFLLPLMKVQKYKEALKFHQQGYYLIHNEVDYLEELAQHIEYLTIVDVNQAIALLENHIPEVVASYEPEPKFYFFRAASLLLRRLDDKTIQTIYFPESVTPEWIHQQVQDLAQQFDQRNGNLTFQNRLSEKEKEIQELKEQYARYAQKRK